MEVRGERVVVEHTKWRADQVKEATGKILGLYSQGLGVLVSNAWEEEAKRALESTNGQRCRIGALELSGVEFHFIGPQFTAWNINNAWFGNENISNFWVVLAPRVELVDKSYGFAAPSFRNSLYHVTEDVGETVFDLFDMDMLRDPIQFVFPKSRYASLSYSTGLFIPKN